MKRSLPWGKTDWRHTRRINTCLDERQTSVTKEATSMPEKRWSMSEKVTGVLTIVRAPR